LIITFDGDEKTGITFDGETDLTRVPVIMTGEDHDKGAEVVGAVVMVIITLLIDVGKSL
jgi:hypothetical protein